MSEDLPRVDPEDIEYPHQIHGNETNQDSLQQFAYQYPSAIHPGLVPHLENQGYDMSAVKDAHSQLAHQASSIPQDKKSLWYGNPWEAQAASSSIDETLSGSPETVKQSKFKKFLSKLAFKKTVDTTEVDSYKIMTSSRVGMPSLSEQGLRGLQANGKTLQHDAWSGWYGEEKTEVDIQDTIALTPDTSVGSEQRSTTELLQGNTGENTLDLKNPENRRGTFVERAPKFSDQLADDSRTGIIEYAKGRRNAMGTSTELAKKVGSLSEYKSINQLADFLREVSGNKINSHMAGRAQSMLENMTFIGTKEYAKATKGIAEIWRKRLSENPKLQMCVVTGQISSSIVKSDAYLLDNILKNFSDEDIEAFGDRLVMDPEELTQEPEDVTIVMLDDWSISGMQLEGASSRILRRFPEYKDSMEVQLIAASEQRIEKGINSWIDGPWSTTEVNIPVNAYYVANKAPSEYSSYGAHITGAHCAVDFDFNNEISSMASTIEKDMPPATNIIRPYRKPGVNLLQRERLERRRQVNSPTSVPARNMQASSHPNPDYQQAFN